MGFDGEAFGRQMVEIVRNYVDAELAPLLAENGHLTQRIAVLEAREASPAVPGDKGEPGQPGKDGRDGIDGAPGADGSNGKDGAPGIDGKDGADGAPGIDGKDGQDGIDGKDGSPGENGKDGKDGNDGKDGEPGANGRDGRDGHDVEDIEVLQNGADLLIAFTVGDIRSEFQIELPAGPAGSDGQQGERGEKGETGSLPAVKAWSAGVHYTSEVRSHLGSLWQAVRDTGAEPPHEDWILLASRGTDGADGLSLNPRRLWSADEEYRKLDVVALNGGSFVALRDGPGPCPGDGWMLLTSPGRRGERGEKGERGERGLPAATVSAIDISDEGVLTLTNADGSQVHCDFYPILTKISR